jgi:hypothetical protein
MPLAGHLWLALSVRSTNKVGAFRMSNGQEKPEDLEQKIRDLCATAIITQDEAELRAIFIELRATMHEKMRVGRLRLAKLQEAEQEISKKIEPLP